MILSELRALPIIFNLPREQMQQFKRPRMLDKNHSYASMGDVLFRKIKALKEVAHPDNSRVVMTLDWDTFCFRATFGDIGKVE